MVDLDLLYRINNVMDCRIEIFSDLLEEIEELKLTGVDRSVRAKCRRPGKR